MSSALEMMASIFDLEPLERNIFRGVSPQVGWQRVFGGHVIGQALVAACRTVEGSQPHSLHAYFLLPGDPRTPIRYEVDRIRDGRSFATRRVVALQNGAAIFTMAASFHRAEAGFDHQQPMPEVPGPYALPTDRTIAPEVLAAMPAAVRAYYERERPIELRPVDLDRYIPGRSGPPRFHVWFRATQPLPDDAAMHRCLLAYASDLALLDAALIPHGRTLLDPSIQAASLDHAIWFHRPFRADDWLLYTQDSPSASHALGFARGLIFDRAGRLVASVAQEGLIRRKAERGETDASA